MKTDTADKILEFIRKNKQASVKEIVDNFNFSYQAIFKHLNKLLQKGMIYKIGRAPKVFYAITEKQKQKQRYQVSDDIKKIINDNFLTITPIGVIKHGFQGFKAWCLKKKQNVEKSAKDYASIIKKYDKIRKNGLLNGMKKMKNTFSKVYVNNLFYMDFYAIERFGKTKLGQTLLYAKQSQDKKMIKQLARKIKPRINQIIKEYKIQAVGFIPPTVKREIQFMKELERNLNFKKHKIRITKVKTPVIVPQKTLNKLEDRIENAQKTFVIENQPSYANILLIDDAVGSGATINEISKQIKEKKIAKKIIALVITGSLKGFDVISEV